MDIVEMDGALPLWAVVNERRLWKPADIETLRRDPSAVERFAEWGLRSQKTLDGEPVVNKRLEAARRRLLEMFTCGINAFTLTGSGYPKRLALIPDPPLVLYSVGTVSVFDKCVAVSGTRSPSDWGLDTAERLGAALALEGWVVTSGLARGTDTAAHYGALGVPAGRTVAVSPLPLDRIYPPENQELARMIMKRGAVVTEHALNRDPGKVSFLRRNRIISGLSFAHFIVENSGGGGTLAQATDAISQGRPLYAMEPPVEDIQATAGFRELVRLGAKPCRDADEAVGFAREHAPNQ